MIFLSVVIGIAQGCQPILGFNFGAGNYVRVRQTYYRAISAAFAFCTLGFICFQLFPRQIIELFGKANGSDLNFAHYIEFAQRYFRVFLFMTFLGGVQPVTALFFTAIGKAVRGLFLSLTRQILFLCPLVFVLPLFLGIEGILYAGPASDAVMAVLAMTLIWHEMRVLKALDKTLAT